MHTFLTARTALQLLGGLPKRCMHTQKIARPPLNVVDLIQVCTYYPPGRKSVRVAPATYPPPGYFRTGLSDYFSSYSSLDPRISIVEKGELNQEGPGLCPRTPWGLLGRVTKYVFRVKRKAYLERLSK
eukprot:scaffold5708_cov125-Skeletonema_marinoi.AAC.1